MTAQEPQGVPQSVGIGVHRGALRQQGNAVFLQIIALFVILCRQRNQLQLPLTYPEVPLREHVCVVVAIVGGRRDLPLYLAGHAVQQQLIAPVIFPVIHCHDHVIAVQRQIKVRAVPAAAIQQRSFFCGMIQYIQ